MKKNIWLVAAICSLMACENADHKKLESLQKEVESMHDKLMGPYMEIEDLRTEIRQKISKDTTGQAQAELILLELTQAEKGMDNWMNNYNGDTLENLSAEEGEKYLLSEKKKVTQVESLTNASVASAKQFLKK
ncbi:MAG: hypothetical protein QM669_01260 [Siphonobacter sp.]